MRSILVKLTVVTVACVAVFLLLGSFLVHPSHVQAAVAAPSPGIVSERLGRVEFGVPESICGRSSRSPLPVPRMFLAEDKIWIGLTTFSPERRNPFLPSERYRWEIPNIDKEYDWKTTGQVLVAVRQEIHEWKDRHLSEYSALHVPPIDVVISAEGDVRYGDLIKAMDLVVARDFEGFSISEGNLETLGFPGTEPFEEWRQ